MAKTDYEFFPGYRKLAKPLFETPEIKQAFLDRYHNHMKPRLERIRIQRAQSEDESRNRWLD
jgi:hypothetical protein